MIRKRGISVGFGVQSTCMYGMAAEGELGPIPDFAVFSDTQREPTWVYSTIEAAEKRWGHLIPIIVETAGNLGTDWFDGQVSRTNDENAMPASLPFHIQNSDGTKGMTLRTCTKRYKLEIIQRVAREQLGLKRGQRAKGLVELEMWIGISTDEAHRMKTSQIPWITHRYPLAMEVGFSRNDCIQWLKKAGFPEPRRSACDICPFRSPAEWRDLRDNDPITWEAAVEFDTEIREKNQFVNSRAKLKKPLRGIPYLHASLVPLGEADLGDNPNQLDLWGSECEGGCSL